MAVGAGRWRLLRQSLADALVLSTLAGLAGVFIAQWTSSGLVRLAPSDVPRLDTVRFDARTVMFAWVICLIVATVAGVVPGVHASRWNIADVLKIRQLQADAITEAQARVRGRADRRSPMTLLVSAGLVGRSFVILVRLDFGFDPTQRADARRFRFPMLLQSGGDIFYSALLIGFADCPGLRRRGRFFCVRWSTRASAQTRKFLFEGQRVEELTRNPKREL